MRLPARLEEKFIPEPNTGCWLWIAALDRYGYGRYWHDGRVMKAHRATYLLLRGPLIDGLDIDHLCRVRCCVNPAHLEQVTRAVNLRRGDAGKVNNPMSRRTHCPQGHEYTDENTKRNRHGRHCRTCAREYSRAYRAAKRAGGRHL